MTWGSPDALAKHGLEHGAEVIAFGVGGSVVCYKCVENEPGLLTVDDVEEEPVYCGKCGRLIPVVLTEGALRRLFERITNYSTGRTHVGESQAKLLELFYEYREDFRHLLIDSIGDRLEEE